MVTQIYLKGHYSPVNKYNYISLNISFNPLQTVCIAHVDQQAKYESRQLLACVHVMTNRVASLHNYLF